MKYAFFFGPSTGERGTFSVHRLEGFGRSPEQALETISSQVPCGSTCWTWIELRSESCTFCGGPFHPATGHWVSIIRHWCLRCTLRMWYFRIAQSQRTMRWLVRSLSKPGKPVKAKIEFYDHAFVPPEVDTSVDDLAMQAYPRQKV
jgi:hypothetical protein